MAGFRLWTVEEEYQVALQIEEVIHAAIVVEIVRFGSIQGIKNSSQHWELQMVKNRGRNQRTIQELLNHMYNSYKLKISSMFHTENEKNWKFQGFFFHTKGQNPLRMYIRQPILVFNSQPKILGFY